MTRYLFGPITAANTNPDFLERRDASEAEYEGRADNRAEWASSLTLRFARGFSGYLKASSTASQTGAFIRIDGVKGSLEFSLGTTSRLHVRVDENQMVGTDVPIDAEARHFPSGPFTGLFHRRDGRLDTVAIAAIANLNAVTRNASSSDFRQAWQIEQVVEAAAMSARLKTWRALNDELPTPDLKSTEVKS